MIGTLLVFSGMLMIMAGLILIFLANHNAAQEYGGEMRVDSFGTPSETAGNEPFTGKTQVKGGGIIMLGPIPIIIGSDSSSTKTLVILAIILMVLYFIIFM